MPSKRNRTLWALVTFASIVVSILPPVAAAQAPVVPSSGQLTFAGSTTVQPLVAELATVFEQKYPGMMLDIAAGGSEVGLQAIRDATVDIGMVSRDLKPDESSGLVVHQIAIDAIAIVVSPDNPLIGLTLEQLADIYMGRVTNWKAVGGPDLAIVPVVREKTSGTRAAFDSRVLKNQEPAASTQMVAMTAGDAAAAVAQTHGAVGYVGFGNLDTRLKPLAVNGITPTPETVGNGSFPLARPLQLLTGPLSQPSAEAFIAWVLSAEGQALVEKNGWVRVGALSTMKDQSATVVAMTATLTISTSVVITR